MYPLGWRSLLQQGKRSERHLIYRHLGFNVEPCFQKNGVIDGP
jgi:hypothetical protein